jgi:YidC/Oxa1 family membrane protein insertase
VGAGRARPCAAAEVGSVTFGFFEIFATALAAIFGLVRDYGLSIILLTLLVRLILLPLSIKQTRSMREMQRIQPELRKLQQKHKGDRQKFTEAQMALYKEHGVNPFGGCGPLALQFPVLIALYWVIRQPLEYMRQIADWALPRALDNDPLDVHRFLGLRLDCAASTVRAGAPSDAVSVACGSGFADVIPYLLLLGLMGLTTYYQSRQMQAAQGPTTPQQQQMQTVMRIMPVILVVVGWSFPAALVLYWTVTNVWTIVQQRIMLQGVPALGLGPAAPVAKTDSSGDGAVEKPAKGKPSTTKPSSSRPAVGDGSKGPATASRSSRRRKKR